MLKIAPGSDFVSQPGCFLAYHLGMRGVIPEIMKFDFFFQFFQFNFLSGEVKDAPLTGAIHPPWFLNDLTVLAWFLQNLIEIIMNLN